jgi:hypothetical protein
MFKPVLRFLKESASTFPSLPDWLKVSGMRRLVPC